MKDKNIPVEDNLIITSNEIRSILNEYRIGKKPLAKLLGWGETTIIRYIEGDIPTTEYSEKLRAIHEEPIYFYDLLLKNKENITSVAFRKSSQAVINKILESKINVIANYAISANQGDVSPGLIQSILFYAQAFSLALYDKELFSDEYGVNKENMPYYRLYQSMKNYTIHIINIPEINLTADEKSLIENVTESFSWYGPKALKALSSIERSHLRISRDKAGNKIIAKEFIKNYFKNILEKYDIHNTDEIYKYPEGRILEIKNQ